MPHKVQFNRLIYDSRPANDTEDRPLWAPVRAAVFGKDPVVGGGTRSAAVNNQWTQDRVEAAGYVDKGDNKCRACDAAVRTAVSDALEDYRIVAQTRAALAAAQVQAGGWEAARGAQR